MATDHSLETTTEGPEMGRVLVEALIENFGDLWELEKGRIFNDQVRRLYVTEALVDTGASILTLSKQKIQELGLKPVGQYSIRITGGPVMVTRYGTVKLTIQGRDCVTYVVDAHDGTPVLIGQINLEMLDFVIDMRTHKVIGNPAHGGEWMFENY